MDADKTMGRIKDFWILEQRRTLGQLSKIVDVCGIEEVVKTLAAICQNQADQYRGTPEGGRLQIHAERLRAVTTTRRDGQE